MPSIRIRQIHFTPHFFRAFRKLPHLVQARAKKKDQMFRATPFDTRLHTHKLKGELTGAWSYSVNYEYRVLFRFIRSDEVLYYDIGKHEIYR